MYLFLETFFKKSEIVQQMWEIICVPIIANYIDATFPGGLEPTHFLSGPGARNT